MQTGDLVTFGGSTGCPLRLVVTVVPKPAVADMLPHECTCARCGLLCLALLVRGEERMRGSSAWVCLLCDRMIAQEGVDVA